jgi:hypothetical protein
MAMLRKVAGECSDGVSCPAVYVDDDETVIVQGYTEVSDQGTVPSGEARVRVPRAVLLEAVEELA